MREIGEYLLLEEKEESPLGTLCFAEHKILKRKAALKKLGFSVSSVSREDLQNTISSLAETEHPNLARLQNVAFSGDECYFAYDWVSSEGSDSPNWNRFSSTRPVSEESVLSIGLQIASALDAIHAAGVLHLGVKASNVLLRDGGKTAFLTDTGLAHLFPPGVYLLSLLEKCIKKMGKDAEFSSFWESFHALAPEQKLGSASAASDVYAFGVMLYKALMGKYPEGRFPLPSETGVFTYFWDQFFISSLDPDPENRPHLLVKALEGVAKKQTEEVLTPVFKPTELQRPKFDADPGAIFQAEHMVVKYKPEEQEPHEVEAIPTKMVVIPGGAFLRGSNRGSRDEMPRHAVHLSPFAIDIHPVTNEQFARFLEAMGAEKDGNNNDMVRLRESRIKKNGGKIHVESGYNKHPVIGITWYGAVAYAKWVGKRLPTEAEWEIAAYGGNEEALYPTGSDIERSQANYFSSDTNPVMSYPPNGYGLYDMAGNVYEWCSDWYEYNYYEVSVQEPVNPQGPAQGVYRVLRGGCWKSLKDDLRCAHRHRNNPGSINGTYGFRCVADVSVS